MSSPTLDRLPTESLARVLGAVALVALAIVHVIDLPDTFDETPLIAYGYLALIAACLFGAFLLLTTDELRVWLIAAGIAAGAALAYVLSRTTGLPTDDDDIGNWACLLGIAALSTEATLLLLAGWRAWPAARESAAPLTSSATQSVSDFDLAN
jgi:hypothetical protein